MEGKTTTEAKWDWIPCNYNLKREIHGKTTFWNLSPSIILTNPTGSGADPNVKLFIDTEKSLQFSNDLGWNWHKSWNLPNISVRLEIKDSVSGELFLSPKNLYSHLFAVKAVLDHKDNFHLVDIGLRGVNKIELLDGHAFFSAIKFSSTSYNNEGVKFHLVLCLYILGEEDNVPKILNSTISPPIFVDSRKSARDSQVLLEKKMSSFVEPFLPENLEKIFIKRENKRKNDIEIQIYNDVDGLFNYLTAPNIRHKVKHPLFLSLKFSKCVKLCYNSLLVKNESLEELIDFLQKQLCEDHRVKKTQNPANNFPSNESKMFLLLFEETGDSFKTKKIIEAVEPIQSNSFGLLYSKNQLPENFLEVTNIPEMINLYRKNFANLFSASKIRRQTMLDKDDSDEDSRGSESESEDGDSNIQAAPSKKLKSNKESCQNLVGLDSKSNQSSSIKDPFSILVEKNENINLNLSEIPENREDLSQNKAKNELKEIIIQKKEADIEEEKNHSETSKSEYINNDKKKQPESESNKRLRASNNSFTIPDSNNQNSKSFLLNQLNSNITSNTNFNLASSIPNQNIINNTSIINNNNQANFTNSQSNNINSLASFIESLNRFSPNMQQQTNPNIMSLLGNPALMALLANNQNPLNMMLNQQQKNNIPNLMNPNLQSQQQQQPQPQPQENRESLLKALQKNITPQNNNINNYGMNFNNYAILNSLLMNSAAGGNNTSQYNPFENLFGNSNISDGGENQKTANNAKNNNVNWNLNSNINNANNTNNAIKQNEALLQMTLNSLMMKNNSFGGSNNNNQMNAPNQNQESFNNSNYLKALLMQAMKSGNPNQILNVASMLNKSQENNGIIKKEEDK